MDLGPRNELDCVKYGRDFEKGVRLMFRGDADDYEGI